jgi:beta-galactosidase/beta-glucuronidase
MVRKEWLNLNGLWQMAERSKGESPPLGKQLAEQILVPFPVESALSGVMKRADRLWYRRIFEVPQGWAGKRTLLHFGAVDWEATVWINGKKLGSHQGGYDGFSLDITEALKPSGDQEIVVGVWDPADSSTQPRGKQVRRPEGIYYTPTTGIWQTVWLESVSEAHIEALNIVPDFDSSKVRVAATLTSAQPNDRLAITVLDGAKNIASGQAALGSKVDVEIAIPSPKPWSPQSPFLYDLRVELQREGKAVDTVHSYFGLRKISIGKDEKGTTRILLNNHFLFQIGLLDQGFWPDGLYTAPTDAALKYDIETTLRLGFNLARKHVKVEPERWYYWCDKLGLLVWQDMPSGDRGVAPGKGEIHRSPESARQYEIELKRMIEGPPQSPLYHHVGRFQRGLGAVRYAAHHPPDKGTGPKPAGGLRQRLERLQGGRCP